MAISEFEIKRCEKELSKFLEKRRPPAHIRKELDIGYEIREHSVELFEVRPMWDNPTETIRSPIAKATYVKTQKLWQVFWERADLKWHSYEPTPPVKTFEKFLDLVNEDRHACFFG